MLRPVKPTAAQIKLERAQRAYDKAARIFENASAKFHIVTSEILAKYKAKGDAEK